MSTASAETWANPGDKGTPKVLALEDLLIDHTYQRPEVSEKNTRRIAENLDWDAFGIPVVMQRSNGKMYIVDGQQRIHALRYRGDFKRVLCLLFQSTGPQQEAMAFHRLNRDRRNVSPVYRFNAAVTARMSPETQINKWLKDYGFIVSTSQSSTSIRFPGVLINLWKIDEESSKSSLILQNELCGADDTLSVIIHKGLWYLYRNAIAVDRYQKKILRAGGLPRLLQAIRAVELIELQSGGRGASNRACAVGILKVINKGARNKIKLPTEDEDEK